MSARRGRRVVGAREPDDVARLLVERAAAGDVDGMLDLYEEDAVLAYPPGQVTRGRAAIRAVLADYAANCPAGPQPAPMATVVHDDLALTVTAPESQDGVRAQLLRRQDDGRWLRLIDQPAYGLIPPPIQG